MLLLLLCLAILLIVYDFDAIVVAVYDVVHHQIWCNVDAVRHRF